jgi:hypothetical protein
MAKLHHPLDDLYDHSDDDSLFDDVEDTQEPTPKGTASHPVRSMQGPFDESLIDSLERVDKAKKPLKLSDLSAEERRRRLLEDEEYNDTYFAMWRDTPSSKFHPLAKVIAQIVFGLHLLHNRLAASDEEVIKILQKHIDEVDEFVGRADEDLEMAVVDIDERIQHLEVPLKHIDTFEVMLADRQYRLQTLEGNENIEKIINRTSSLMSDIQSDLTYGLEAIKDMWDYLSTVSSSWPQDESSMALYNAMLANSQGWLDIFGALQDRSSSLADSLVKLRSFLNEIAERAGIASRRQVSITEPLIIFANLIGYDDSQRTSYANHFFANWAIGTIQSRFETITTRS